MPDGTALLLGVTIIVALGFDFTNGFHDTANAVATTVGTRAMTPRAAVATSALFNLVGALVATQLLHSKVADTIGSLVKPQGAIALSFIVGALLAAIAWNLITWRAGLPSSSSHALIGALVGMGLAGYGVGAVRWEKVGPVVLALVTSPVVGIVFTYVAMVILLNALRRAHPSSANRLLRRTQFLSSGFVSFSHGANDAQKTMGIITLALVSTGHLASGPQGAFPDIPAWVATLAAVAIGLGTYAGGWRIIRTVGSRIVRFEPVDGFAAQAVGAAIIQSATQLALPVSTTHVITGCVVGAGATTAVSSVRWGVARDILVAWVLTIPATAVIAAVIVGLLRLRFG
jgi:inorganic phosphate transporter, PiT family